MKKLNKTQIEALVSMAKRAEFPLELRIAMKLHQLGVTEELLHNSQNEKWFRNINNCLTNNVRNGLRDIERWGGKIPKRLIEASEKL